MGWNRHDCASAIFHENKIGEIDRDLFFSKRVYGICAGKEAQFFFVIAVHGHERSDFIRIGDKLLSQRMVGRETDKCRPEKRVRPCRVYLYLFTASLYLESDFSAFALADPVSLHCDNPFRPSLKFVASL